MAWRAVVSTAVVVCAFLGSGAVVSADGLDIEHEPVGCVVAEQLPSIEARFRPPDAVGRAQVYFRAAGMSHWYFVEMRLQDGVHRAALPKPRESTPSIEYYVEVLDKTAAPTRTADQTARVVQSSQDCGGQLLATLAPAGKIVVGAPPGAPPLPAGFVAGGVVSAAAAGAVAGATAAGTAGGGGLSTGLLIGAGVVAAGAGVAVAATGGGGGDGDESVQLNFFFTPSMDVTACGGSILNGQAPVPLGPDGSFDVTGTQVTPNLIRYVGRASASSLEGTITCASRSGPTGTLSASGSNYSMTGSFSFGNAPPTQNGASQGTLRVERQ